MNETKTQQIIVGHHHVTDTIKNSIADPGKLARNIKTLGLTIDENLTWEDHINEIFLKGKQRIGMLYKKQAQLPTYLRLILMNSMVLSLIDYCSVIYAGTLKKQELSKLQRLQTSAMRFIIGKKSSRTEVNHAMITHGWLNIKQRHKYLLGQLAYNIINNLSIGPLNAKLQDPRQLVAGQATTRAQLAGNFQQQHSTHLEDKRLSDRLKAIWNEIPNNIRDSKIGAFENQLKKHLLILQEQTNC